jgi:hypothetical protein
MKATLALYALGGGVLWAGQPQFGAIDYAAPARYLAWPDSLGDRAANRFAYDKGNDPKAMVMSLQWEEWKRQTEACFRDLDESLLPVDSGEVMDLGVTAFVAGNSPCSPKPMQNHSRAWLPPPTSR